ncbi:MAG: TonB-dependent receptor [Niveispirillum sp.]|uniref:TonB-dependent receptor n=1 Tax=Niveispirillum sp. TaxID=1917217 RepID=UPI004036047B
MRTDKALVWLVAAVMGSAVAAAPAMAQQEPAADSSAHDRVEEIIVTASPIGAKRFDILQGTSSLSGEALDRALSTTLGEALDKLPGLSQTAFGSGASRPIIRGQGGDRIRILSGGIGSIDASSTSPDHAPALDLATAKRVEVVRGPATLLYGNNAVGGVINVLDGRIPIAEPKDGVDGFARIGVGSNADERSLASGIDARLNGPFVLHLDGFYRQADDYKVPGFLESKVLREEEDHEHEGEEEEAKGRVDNSDLTQKGATAGLSYLGDWGFLGVSASRFDSNYGVPAGHSHEGEEGGEEEGPVRIDLGQTRLDLMGEVNQPYGIFETTRVRFGWADYEHKELEGGETGTRFLNKGWEGRIEMVQRAMGDLSGAVGVQASSRNFKAIGDEAFLPPSDTDQMGVFTLQRLDLSPFALEGGVRVERQNVTAGSVDFDRDFTTVSLSAGASRQLGDGWMTGVTLSRTQRAPNAEELLSDGAHLATSTYERGDATLGKETGLGVEATLKKSGGPVTGSVNLFLTDYDKYIYERLTGAEQDGLPLAQFSATDARFWGFEVEAETTVLRNDQVTVTLDGGVDYVRATDRDNDTPLPRIPALSARAGVGFELATVAARFEGVWTDKQKRIADYELPTDDAMVFNASLDWHPIADRDVTLLLELRNLTNEEVRLATSFLKDVLPQPGRDFRLSLRSGF